MIRKDLIKKITTNLNLLSDNILSNLSRHIDYEVRVIKDSELKAKNWYSKRHDFDATKDLGRWEMLTIKTLKETRTSSNKFSNPIFDKVYMSRFGDINPFNGGYPHYMTEIYISDFIMFNPNCVITIDLVDRILPYIKFKRISSNSYQIDRWLFEEKGFYVDGSNIPNYGIEYLNTDTTDMDFVKYEEDKWLIVRAMLQIMNETPNEYLNFNSYQVIGNWYNKYDSWLVSWNPNTWKQFNTNSDEKQKQQIKPEDLRINLDGRLELDELVKILYSGAKYGGDDLSKTNVKYDKRNFNTIIDFVFHQFNKSFKTGDYIEKISDAIINTKLDRNQIDLNGYLNANGEERTINIIDNINRNIKYRYNCDKIVKSNGKKITKSDLLCVMYNIRLPYGMGWIQAIEKIKSDGKYKLLEPSDADKILSEEDNYIDYLYIVPIKTSFHTFPIIDYQRYNKFDDGDTFNKCVEILKKM
jgi:hypothetical protein